MNAEILKSAGIDYDKGVKRFVGRAPLYEKTLIRFTRDTTFERVEKAYESGDADALFAGVHEFKGMCGNIALTGLYDKADYIVRLLRGGEYAKKDIDEGWARLFSEYRETIGAIKAAMEESV